MATQIQLRRGTASEWTTENPTLAAGEAGVETDTGAVKFGDGSTAWNSLPYSTDNATTQVWLSPADFPVVAQGSPVETFIGSRFPGWLLDPDFKEGVVGTPRIPSHWSSLSVDLYWSNAGAGSGDVAWEVLSRLTADGSSLASGGGAGTASATVAAPSQDVLKVTSLTGTITAGNALGLLARRNGDAAGDTLGNDATLIGVLLRKAS